MMDYKYKIIVIDDNELILKLVETIFQGTDFTVKIISHAKDIIREIKAFQPDIILLDVKLYGQSGIEVVKLIKMDKDIRTIPVIAFTSYAMKEDKQKFLEMGYDGYLSKPINIYTFVQEIQQYIKR
ncbi:MAG: response regulator [bacterium]|nr:response regulator [bacterium]